MRVDYNWDLKEWPVQTHLRSKTMGEHIEKIECLFGDKLSPWIRVENRLPEEEQRVLFVTSGGAMIIGIFAVSRSGLGKAIFVGDKIGQWHKYPYLDVDRWMPIPPPE